MIETKLKFADDFFTAEETCGFYVTKKRKEVWAIELDLLHEFDQVCRKHGLQYYLDGGSLLGAVRHKGFIPWDDDIDLIMFRADYDRLLKIAPDEFKHPYFFQHAYTDVGYCRGHAQLRNSRTCGALNDEMFRVRFNQGIFIDIFVLDNVSDDQRKVDAQLKKMQYYIQLMKRMAPQPIPQSVLIGTPGNKNFRIENLMHVYNLYEACASRYDDEPSQFVTSIAFLGKVESNRLARREWFGEPNRIRFECLTAPIPSNADAILRVYYGDDYMTPLNKSPVHAPVIFDTDHSYLEIIASFRL